MVSIYDLTYNKEIAAEPEQPLISVCPLPAGRDGWPVAGAFYHNKFVGLQEKAGSGGRLRWVSLASPEGNGYLIRTCILLLVRAVADLYKNGIVRVRHALCKALYCELDIGHTVTAEDVARIKARMDELIRCKEPVEQLRSSKETIARTCRDLYDGRAAELREHIVAEDVAVYRCGSVTDCYVGPLLPDMGYITCFNLRPYAPGVILETPKPDAPGELPAYREVPKMARLFLESEEWGRIICCEYVADLNRYIADGTIRTIIDVSEALQAKKMGAIADMIVAQKPAVKVVLVAGPSSSGKTTFCKRLRTQLQVVGLRPVVLSLDDYFLEREETPRNPDGTYDFESLRAVDTELFSRQINELQQGRPVCLSRFDFTTGRRYCDKDSTRMPAGGLIMVEGLHALNDSLTYMLPRYEKFKISLGVLTQIRINDHNRISTADTRIIRRMIRDSRFRSRGPETTLKEWENVRHGEETNIYPYQEDADVIFNTALPYELSVMKPYAEALLDSVSSGSRYYSEARRLQSFMRPFPPLSQEAVPYMSILREFIGPWEENRPQGMY